MNSDSVMTSWNSHISWTSSVQNLDRHPELRPTDIVLILCKIIPRVVQRSRQEPDVARLLDRVVEVERVRVRGRDDC